MREAVVGRNCRLGPPGVYWKDSVVKGQSVKIECLDIGGQCYAIDRGAATVVGLEDFWFEDQKDPGAVVEALKEQREIKADIFTFWQRLPNLKPQFDFPMETEDLAAIPVRSYEEWWNGQIKSRIRGLIRKTQKEGIEVRETEFDDSFARALTKFFNETATRQGRKSWHYGKDLDTVNRQFSRFAHREVMIGAYKGDEIIGAVMMGNAGSFGLTGQIISSIEYRELAVNNALIAKAVEVCERLCLGHLCYFFWSDDSLAEFKRRCGFEVMAAPRYFVPLTNRGWLAIRTGMHRGWKAMIPDRIRRRLKGLRRSLNERGAESGE